MRVVFWAPQFTFATERNQSIAIRSAAYRWSRPRGVSGSQHWDRRSTIQGICRTGAPPACPLGHLVRVHPVQRFGEIVGERERVVCNEIEK
jgi:hypothetical protein